MKINEVGKTKKVLIQSGRWVLATDSDDIKNSEGVIVTSGTPYEVFGLLTSDKNFIPSETDVASIRLSKGDPTVFLEIGEDVELWLKTNSNMDETVYIQEFK